MKKLTLFVSALVASMTMTAEVITLDLSNVTKPATIEYDANDWWKETKNDAAAYATIESQIFAFSHIPSKNSWSGTSWEGFTISKATKDGDDAKYEWFSNVAKGGLKGEGTPYIFAYYSEYWTLNDDVNNPDMQSSNIIKFNDGKAYFPRYVYLNNSLITYKNIMNGGGAARKFVKGDKFIVRIQGLDKDYEHDITDDENRIEVLLADYTADDEKDWYVNTEWLKVDLSSLGQVYGLAFVLVSTDQGLYGTNTATYFALDGLTVSSTKDEVIPTAIDNTNAAVKATKVMRNGQVVILRDGKAFNVLGAEL